LEHFTNTTIGLQDLTTDEQVKVELADKSTLTTAGIGTFAGKLPRVLYCPQFASPLLSISQLYRDGKATIFHPTQGIMVANAECMEVRVKGTPLLVGKATENGFITDINVMSSKNSVKYVNAPTNTVLTYAQALQSTSATTNTKPHATAEQLWMLRLGFPNPERVIKLAKNNLATGVKISPAAKAEDFEVHSLEAYHLGKSKARSHKMSPPKTKRSSKPFEFIHMDIKVTNIRTLGGNKYLLVICDDYTRWREAIPMATKGEVANKFKTWYLSFVKNLGYTTQRIRLDNAGENVGTIMAGFCLAHSIRLEPTNKYSSASNGTAERSIGILTSTIRTLLVSAHLPQTLWAEAAITATYLVNRLPTTANPGDKTPFEMLYGKPPDLAHLKVFGCRAYVHRHKPEREVATFSPTAVAGVLVGYATSTNGYRILVGSTGKVEETAHVDFAETVLPGMPPTADVSFTTMPEQFSVVGEPIATTAAVQPSIVVAELPTTAPAEPPSEAAEPEPTTEPEATSVEPDQPAGIDHLLEEELLPERERKPPQYLKDYVRPAAKRAKVVANATVTARAARINYKEAVKDPGIRDAMKAELDHLLSSGAVKIVDLPQGRKAIKSTWAHKRKLGPDGEFVRYKSRICPYGFQQVPGIDYDEVEQHQKIACIYDKRQ
jgi:hypothetical protein